MFLEAKAQPTRDFAILIGIFQLDLNHGETGMTAEEKPAAERSLNVTERLAALGEMTGGIAHDLRNILTVIETGLRLAHEQADQPEKVRSYIAVSREAIHRGVNLTSQLLGFAQQRLPDRRDESVNDVLKNLEPFLRYAAGPGARLVFDLAADARHCSFNKTQFEAAILNLVTNARDAMPAGGPIHISTDTYQVGTTGSLTPGEYVRVRVTDSGQGMSAEVVQKVFDPFFTTKGEKGTGMGLPQVYAFIQRIGGGVEVHSKPGLGTTVELFLPLFQR
jgi:signal transduction histidine kinase